MTSGHKTERVYSYNHGATWGNLQNKIVLKGVTFNSEVTDSALGLQLEDGSRFHY